ncbi:non-structural maintenance of chromosome element 4 [Monosporozyma unispora]|nr:nuclear protein [Kazachstania unispora]
MSGKRNSEQNGSVEPSRKRSKHNDNKSLSEFELLQLYRKLENKMSNLKAVAMRGDGNISIALDNLSAANELFEKTHMTNSNNNGIYAYDSKTLVGISELAELNIRNLKFGEIKSMLNLNDMILFTKRYLLKEYFYDNNITEKLERDLLSSAEPDNENEEDDQDGEGNDATTDNDNIPIAQNVQKQVKRQQFLDQFNDYNRFNQFNWFKMGAIFKNYNQSVDVTDHLLGPFSLEKKIRKMKPCIREDDNLAGKKVTTADNVTKEDLNEKQDTTTPEQVIKCHKLLMKSIGYDKRISLFKFILNPTSFAKSIENLFYTSFLIKDGRLILEEDENDGFPTLRIQPALKEFQPEKREIEKQRRAEAAQNHIIFQMDMETWKNLIHKFNITESFIP